MQTNPAVKQNRNGPRVREISPVGEEKERIYQRAKS